MKPLIKMLKITSVVLFSVLFFSGFTLVPDEIDVAPNVLNVASSGTVVTVHTDIAYSDVVGATVELNGVPIDWWKTDSRGQFVAKFAMEEVKELVKEGFLELGTISLTLTGSKVDGALFDGSQEIKVISVAAAGRK